MTVVGSCKSDNVLYHDSDALKIMNQICACPSVRSVLGSLGAEHTLDVRTGSYPGMRVVLHSEEETELQIPRQILNAEDTLGNIALELFNAKHRNELSVVRERASRGELDIEDYAKTIEKIEFKSRDAAIDLALKCNFLKPSQMKDINRDLEVHLWNKEFDCHTDQIRQRWIDSCQKAYCKKNPGRKSCTMKIADVCDAYAVKKLSEDDHYLFRVNRICERLSKLPQKVKDWYPSEVQYCRTRNEL